MAPRPVFSAAGNDRGVGLISEQDIRPLIAREIPAMRRYARALTGDAARADDLVQDSLERALRKHNLWLRRGTLRSWLLRILYRTFLDSRRRKRDTAPHVPIEDAEAPMARAAGQQTHMDCRDVIDALGRLPDDQRAAITLIALEDFGYDEAARTLGVPVGTLRSRLARGRRNLRQMVDPDMLEASAESPPARTAQGSFLRRVK